MIRRIAAKEILNTLRDRRAIISNLLIPFLILPTVMLGLPLLLGGLFQQTQENTSDIAITGQQYLPPALAHNLEAQHLALHPVTDPFAAVESGQYDAALQLTPDFQKALQASQGATLKLYSKQGNLKSELVADKVQDAIDTYKNALVANTLQAAGLDPAVLEPVTITSIDASSQAEQASGTLSWLIPFFIVIWTLAGGQMTAIDATAGEKERGTLEALLVTPVRRSEVVLGKFLATMTFGLAAAVMAILGYVLGGTVMRRVFASQLAGEGSDIASLMGGAMNVNAGGTLMLAVSSLIMAALIAALLIGVTAFARSFKEAQTYVAPLSMVLIIPVVGLQFADFFDFSALVYLVPILNTLLVMNDIVKGNAHVLPLVLTWGSMLAYTALLLDFAYRSFRRESVIFRT